MAFEGWFTSRAKMAFSWLKANVGEEKKHWFKAEFTRAGPAQEKRVTQCPEKTVKLKLTVYMDWLNELKTNLTIWKKIQQVWVDAKRTILQTVDKTT